MPDEKGEQEARMLSDLVQSVADEVREAAKDLDVSVRIVEPSFHRSALVVRLANLSPKPMSLTREFDVPFELLLHPDKIRSIVEDKAKLLKEDDQVSCSDCGLLTTYTTLLSDTGEVVFPEVNVVQRDEGFGDSFCFVHLEYADEGIWEGHDCPRFIQYQQGFDPKEHLQRQDSRRWQESMAKEQQDHQQLMAREQQEHQERMAKEQRRGQASSDRRMLLIGLVLMGTVLSLATFFAPLDREVLSWTSDRVEQLFTAVGNWFD